MPLAPDGHWAPAALTIANSRAQPEPRRRCAELPLAGNAPDASERSRTRVHRLLGTPRDTCRQRPSRASHRCLSEAETPPPHAVSLRHRGERL
ncbi:unnamed protein product [Lampetra fluviatilis]